MRRWKSLNRPDKEEIYLQIALLIGQRSTCKRHPIGAVLTDKKGRFLSIGYNGNVRGTAHCLDIGCLRNDLGLQSGEKSHHCRAIHAEINAITNAAQVGRLTEDMVLYVTHNPCPTCLRAIINAGVKRIFYSIGYPNKYLTDLCEESGVELVMQEVHLLFAAFLCGSCFEFTTTDLGNHKIDLTCSRCHEVTTYSPK